ncbi:MAG: alpha/beta fold hydrolase [Pseudomonadota bacterium]
MTIETETETTGKNKPRKRSRLRMMLYFLLLLVVAGIGVWTFGPREDASTVMAFDAAQIGDDLDAYLETSEASIPSVRASAAKEIVWAFPQSKAKTPVALVFIHGFSASKGEIRPMPDLAAQELKANLFYTRLSGHGRDGNAMGEPTVQDWFNDVHEAIEIDERIGEKVILVTVSTGSTLAALAATHPKLKDRIDGIVFIAPNFKLRTSTAWLLTAPFAETLLPMIVGPERGFEAKNEMHAERWTTRYSTLALLPMAAAVKRAQVANYYNVTIPALFIFSDNDQVVDHTMTRQIEAKWAGPTKIITVDDADDDQNHVIAGDAMSPGTTDRLAADLVEWVRSL